MSHKPKPTTHALGIVRELKAAIGAECRLGRTHLRHLVLVEHRDGRTSQTYTVDLVWDGIGMYEARCEELPEVAVIGNLERNVMIRVKLAIKHALDARRGPPAS